MLPLLLYFFCFYSNQQLYLGLILTSVVIINGVFGFYQEHKSCAIMASFLRLMPQVDSDSAVQRPAQHRLMPATCTWWTRLRYNARFFFGIHPRRCHGPWDYFGENECGANTAYVYLRLKSRPLAANRLARAGNGQMHYTWQS